MVTFGAVENNIRFPGQYFDTESGLYYNYHRFYNPKTGRYVTVDPIGLGGGDLNYYSHVRANPGNNSDYNGLKNKSRCCPPPLPPEWSPCVKDGIGAFCQPSQADFCKIRCMIWAESTDNPNPIGGVPGGGLGQIKWVIWEKVCKKKNKDFDKTKPCDQIKCLAYNLCKEYNGQVERSGSYGYGTLTGPGSAYQNCMECCK